MIGVSQKSFIEAVKGKVIIALLLACFALFMAWGVSKVAFREMLNTVEQISAPNERLRIVNELSRKISGLDQLQKKQALNDPGNYNKFFRASRQLRMVLDTLSMLYADDSVQLERIKSINELLTVRDKQFINYLKVREKLVNDQSFSDQIENFNDLVDKNSARTDSMVDSTVVTSEKRTSTTTLVSPPEDKRGFLNKLFGKKKPDQGKSYKIINEENVKRDTIALSNEGKIVKGVEKSLREIEKEQKIKSERFVDKEAVLANANSLLISQMLNILKKVEGEAVAQIEMNGIQAKKVVNTSIDKIGIIMLVFFLLTILLLYLILTDITRSNRYRKELEAATEEAEYHGKAKQRFLANMSHEIRTPLQSIIGYAELIRHQKYPQHKDIEAIYHSSEHLLQIVNEVLDYNRIVSGKFTFSSQVFNIATLLSEVVAVMRPQAEQKALKMTTDFDLGAVRFVEGDPFRLKQILFNLLSNAIKFTLAGEVMLSVFYKRRGENLHFTFLVKDTGIGFPEEETEHIFNEFEQVDAPEKNLVNQAGAGLGLTIVKSLVENQGGRIYAKSSPGVGSSFMVYLQFKISEEQQVADAGLLNAPAVVIPDKVWVVDDDQLILDLCSLIFEKNQISYTCFNSPRELLDSPWNPAVKFILMDMRMPDMSGIELCKLLRPRVGNEVKIYAMTAQVLPEERAYIEGQGFDGLIMKPFREKELLSVFYEKEASFEEEVIAGEESVAEVAFNPDYLKKMTFGDEKQLLKILKRFVLDCKNDERELLEHLDKEDHSYRILLVHRLAGRIAQMGSSALAAEFRTLEMALAKDAATDEHQKNEIRNLLGKLNQLIKIVEVYPIS